MYAVVQGTVLSIANTRAGFIHKFETLAEARKRWKALFATNPSWRCYRIKGWTDITPSFNYTPWIMGW